MTEDEAKKKWCPMIRFDSTGCINRPDNHINLYCSTSDCMVWIPERRRQNIEHNITEVDGGYCGLIKQ